ncbi:MAG: amino acid permease [Planctomycetota bacterium]
MKTLERRLGLGAVVAISISAMLGSGIFVLPGLAAAKTGPMVFLAYLVAGITVLPAALSKGELATAMPTSGGTYIYLERTFGPLVGTISGLGLWLSLLLKSAFALVGFSAYLAVLVDDVNLKQVAIVLLFVITILNILGVSLISKMQKFIIMAVMAALAVLTFTMVGSSDPTVLDEGFSKGASGFFAATAFVYVSYAGVTKVAAIAEEVKDPGRNLPWGILISWGIVMTVYVLVVYVLVTTVPIKELTNSKGSGYPDLHPIYTLAVVAGGKPAGIAAALLAIVTMISMAVAGLLAASRFPFAMARDQLVPDAVQNISAKFKTPVNAIIATAIVMCFSILFLPIEQIAKLASALIILGFVLECGTVIILRENASAWYKPEFLSPLYPWLQIAGIVSGVLLLVAIGVTSLAAIAVIVVAGTIAYFCYGRKKTTRKGVIAKMGRRTDLLHVPEYKVSLLDRQRPANAAVVVSLFGTERSPETLVEMGACLAHGRALKVQHIKAIPEQLFLSDGMEEDRHSVALRRRIHAMAEEDTSVRLTYEKTVSRDVVQTIHDVAGRLDSEWVLMEAADRNSFGISFQNPVGWLQDHLPCNLAVFKDAGIRYIRQILVFPEPGPHDSLVVATSDRLAQVLKAELNFVCFSGTKEDEATKKERRDYIEQMRALCRSNTSLVEVEGRDEFSAVGNVTSGYDLLVMGAAPNRTMAGRLFGTDKDKLTAGAGCSVLWLKTPFIQTKISDTVAENVAIDENFDLMAHVDSQCIRANVDVDKKESAFLAAVDSLAVHYPDISPIVIQTALWEREQLQNTFAGSGVAMPHAVLNHSGATDSTVMLMTTRRPVDYDTGNEDEADVFIVTTRRPDDAQTHLNILASVSRLCLDTSFLELARAARSDEELLESLRKSFQSLKGAATSS